MKHCKPGFFGLAGLLLAGAAVVLSIFHKRRMTL